MIFGYSREITPIHLLINWLLHIDFGFILFFVISLSCCGVWFFVIVLLQRFIFRCLVLFYLRVSDLDRQSLFNQLQTINHIMVISMLSYWCYKYYSHYRIIKFVGFDPIYYTINFDDVSSSMVFSDLVFVFLLIYCYFDQ